MPKKNACCGYARALTHKTGTAYIHVRLDIVFTSLRLPACQRRVLQGLETHNLTKIQLRFCQAISIGHTRNQIKIDQSKKKRQKCAVRFTCTDEEAAAPGSAFRMVVSLYCTQIDVEINHMWLCMHIQTSLLDIHLWRLARKVMSLTSSDVKSRKS